MQHSATSADNQEAIQQLPRQDDAEQSWLDWANGYSTLAASGLTCTRIDADGADFVLDKANFPPNPNGAVNGGIVALVADQAMGVAAIRTAPAGRQPVTAVLETHFHRPAFAPLTLTASVIPGGRTIRTVQVVVRDKDGKHCASATGTMSMTDASGGGTGRTA
ncbi:PaaI family thioesterase [Aeromicrobium fastidiosum]|nr:PaaI family thioesterase [Aeromicrobium fastidiosum]MBP2389391.1 uncharacterized protein (TIGR00369 family) [Aeromicrobium fastidiosum]